MDSERKRLTLCIVMRAVGDEEIMMMGYMVPEKAGLEFQTRIRAVHLRDFFNAAFGSVGSGQYSRTCTCRREQT